MRTIRYASDTTALHLLMQLGGRIKLTVRYPSGFTPLPQALPTAKIVRPSFAGSEQFMFLYSGAGYRYSCEGEQVGVSTTCQETTAGAYATSWTNVWGGIQSPLNAAGGEDSYGDIHPAVNIFDWLVIYDAGSGCLLPAGTKISVTVYPNVPKTRKQYSLFYNEKASGIDPILGVEKVPLAWSDYRDGQLVVLRERETGSAIVNDVQYESIAIMGPVVGGANAGSYYIQQDNFHLPSGDTWPTNHATLFPALAGAFVPVKIIHSGLQYSAALAWPVYQHAAIPDPYHPATKALPRLESETVNSIDGWNYNFRTWMPL
jgi:hypothetical protein